VSLEKGSEVKLGFCHGNMILKCKENKVSIKNFDSHQIFLEFQKCEVKIQIGSLKKNSFIKNKDSNVEISLVEGKATFNIFCFKTH